MYDSPKYQIDPREAEAFVATQRHGTLIATAPDGFPQVSILPFVKHGDLIELHGVQADPTLAAIGANPRVTFLVSDFLAWTPHDWIDPRNAAGATLHFRAVAYECEALLSTDASAVAGALGRLLEAYEPEASYEPVRDGDLYGSRLRMLATMQLRVLSMKAKFKVGPAAPEAAKAHVVECLRERAQPGDARAADVIESYAVSRRDAALEERKGRSAGQ